MARVEKSVLVAHPPECMFELVDRVEDYPNFLPWCGGTELKLRDEHRTVATIHIAYLGIHQSFTTENLKTRPREMRIRLQDGPFLTSFAAKGRFSGALRRIPVHVVLAPDVALLGAAACIAAGTVAAR